MALELPSSLSPSKVSAFKDCALAFRYSAIDKLPEPPTVAATRGTLVHAALERLFVLEPRERTLAAGLSCLAEAFEALSTEPDFVDLELDEPATATFLDEAEQLVRRYFTLEDPTSVHPIGIELFLEVELGGLHLRGIIDRLELDDDGELIVTDYKTGAAPSQNYEQHRLGGVQFYSLLCERLFGRRPARIQLLYLRDPTVIVNVPTEQSTRALERRVHAVWSAIERACQHEDFRPRPSRRCDWCAFRDRCPAIGADATSVPVAAPALTNV
ncbi:MAG: PD-(D/E)XK nuclease family protein [Acidimicrobiia bacterium]|nr:PD-(D/E)XK nuclease family protein [Acidimicrobiia bacterium]